MNQPSISEERMSQLRDLLKIDDEKKYNIKNFLKQNGLDPAYMNFYKFLKDETFPLPLLGLMKLIESNGYNVQICITKKDEPFDDSQLWESFINSIKASVDANTAIKEAKQKKRVSSSEITLSMGDGPGTIPEIEIKALFDEIW